MYRCRSSNSTFLKCTTASLFQGRRPLKSLVDSEVQIWPLLPSHFGLVCFAVLLSISCGFILAFTQSPACFLRCRKCTKIIGAFRTLCKNRFDIFSTVLFYYVNTYLAVLWTKDSLKRSLHEYIEEWNRLHMHAFCHSTCTTLRIYRKCRHMEMFSRLYGLFLGWLTLSFPLHAASFACRKKEKGGQVPMFCTGFMCLILEVPCS